ncbi:MAG: hypothetical protein KatS3mg058_4500 [Roseiflexus sp.]|nr:MAG: hypothetical protein KatS3mg058_4500 [Roseiflexus sp.]
MLRAMTRNDRSGGPSAAATRDDPRGNRALLETQRGAARREDHQGNCRSDEQCGHCGFLLQE